MMWKSSQHETTSNTGPRAPNGDTNNIPPIAQDSFISKVPTDQLGIKVLYQGSQIEVDVLAVHGLGAIPDITWKEKKSQVNWLQNENMLPRAIPNSRIMRFGYDSLYFCREPVRTCAETIANYLLAELQGYREDCEDRPLIFIGHCFGGLVIQKALTLNFLRNGFEQGPALLCITSGIIFLGTPHAGTVTFTSEGVSHPSIVSLLVSVSDLHLEGDVLRSLESPHQTLTDISKDFLSVCSRYSGVVVINFFEQRISTVGKLYGRSDLQEFVVSEASATLGSYPCYGLPLDHYSLNKFASPEDGNFKFVRRQIIYLYNRAQKLNSTKNLQASKQPILAAPVPEQLKQEINVPPEPIKRLGESSGDSPGQSLMSNSNDVKTIIVAIRTRVDKASRKLRRNVTLVLTLSPEHVNSSPTITTKDVVWKVLRYQPNEPKTLTCTWTNKAGFCGIVEEDDERVKPKEPTILVVPGQVATLLVEKKNKNENKNEGGGENGEIQLLFSLSKPDNEANNVTIVNKSSALSDVALYTIDPTRRSNDQILPVVVVSLPSDSEGPEEGRFSCSLPSMLQVYSVTGLEEKQTIPNSLSGNALLLKTVDINALGTNRQRITFTVYSDNNNKVFLERG